MRGVFFSLMDSYKLFLDQFQRAINDANRDINDVELIAISKKKPISQIKEIYSQGQKAFGENQLNEIEEKWIPIQNSMNDFHLHFVGTLQSRKVRSILDHCEYIHSVDRIKIIKIIKDYENETGNKRKYFIQINTGNEKQKSGVLINNADKFISECKNNYKLEIYGLMCLPPINDNPTKHFLNLKAIAKNNNIKKLSMGMSNDFAEAIKCGSTHIRIGTKIFGPRS